MPLQATSGAASYDGFGGGVVAEPNYIESVFSTYLYTGNGSTQTITNGIDLSTKGGLVWTKSRAGTYTFSHRLVDTVRGSNNGLRSNGTFANQVLTNAVTGFTSTGYTLGPDSTEGNVNYSSDITYVSWTFREQPKFFDVVTYTGNGGTPQNISHSLGSVPGFIIVKPTSITGGWICYHRSLTASGFNPAPYNTINLNSTGSILEDTGAWNSTAPTSTVFTIGSSPDVNTNGATYVAYLFAHDAGGFGLTGTDNVISCGSYTGNGSSTGPVITLGYEPQWVMVKRATGTANGNWVMLDVMRGFSTSTDNELYANLSLAEGSGLDLAEPQATGFQIKSASSGVNASGSDYIYIAIRRGPMKVPTSGTSVFEPTVATVNTASSTIVSSGSVSAVDMTWTKGKANASAPFLPQTRLTGGNYLQMSNTNAESAGNYTTWDRMSGTKPIPWSDGDSCIDYAFRRAPSFFDEVCYTGNNINGRTITHNLTVTPELIIAKRRTGGAEQWPVYVNAITASKVLELNTTIAATTYNGYWNNTAPTSSVFTIGDTSAINASGSPFVAYLFATCAGVSKVGSYTGTGTTLQVDCGFTGGSRFVMIKRTDSTGSWYVWDSSRGIVSGNDPYLLLNSTAAEVTNTDYIDTYSAGFEISSTAPAEINASGGSFIFLAIS